MGGQDVKWGEVYKKKMKFSQGGSTQKYQKEKCQNKNIKKKEE